MKSTKKALVTGGAGFIGSNLTKALIKKKYKVSVVDDLSTGYEKNIPTDVNFFHGEDKNVILFGQIPPFGFPSSYIGANKIKNNATEKRERIEGFNSWAESYCNEEMILKNKKNDSRGDISKLNCTYIDLAKYFEKNGKLTNYLSNFFAFYDYTHLNTKASIILGMLIKQELNASLK